MSGATAEQGATMQILRIAAVAAALSFSVPGLAQNYTERRYNPPAGSKWQIVSETTTHESRPGQGDRDERIQTRADLSIDEKLPDGFFRVTYTNRGIDITGNAPATKLVGDAYSAMRDIPIHARLDSAGRPVAVENLAEIKTTMRGVVDKIAAKFESNPKAAALIRQIFDGLLMVDGRDAATTYLEELPQLAAVQNVGLQPGKTRQDTESNPSPLGGTFKTVLTTRLDSYDDKAGTARFVRKREFDKDSLRDVVMDIARKLAAVGDNKTITPEVLDMMKKVNFSIEGETVYDVENGMTVRIDDREFTTASVMGTTFTKQQKKTVAVTRPN
jgi:hypothetical protein